MSDARESGSVENDTDVAILIHREDFYEPESPRAGEADLIVDKNRNGPRHRDGRLPGPLRPVRRPRMDPHHQRLERKR